MLTSLPPGRVRSRREQCPHQESLYLFIGRRVSIIFTAMMAVIMMKVGVLGKVLKSSGRFYKILKGSRGKF